MLVMKFSPETSLLLKCSSDCDVVFQTKFANKSMNLLSNASIQGDVA